MRILLPASLLTLLLCCKTPSYFSQNDFDNVRKFDSHVHLNTLQTAYIDQAAADNVQFLDIVDDRPFGITMYEQEKIAIHQSKTFPERLVYATTFPTKNFNAADWQEQSLKKLKQSFREGAVAVKVWKNIGMELKDANGNFVMIDHPAFKPLLDYLEKNNIPLIGHLGEPRECWLPLDSMKLHRSYYESHPEYHMYLHPEFPSYEEQIAARDRMLEKHPSLKFIGAHLGSLEWSLDELSLRLAKYPNMAIDLARWNDLYLHAKTDYKKTREFFIKYQDRLLYATDVQVAETTDTSALKKRVHDSRMMHWQFLASGNSLHDPSVGNFNGLKLPKKVIEKIYYRNAYQWLGKLPKRVF